MTGGSDHAMAWAAQLHINFSILRYSMGREKRWLAPKVEFSRRPAGELSAGAAGEGAQRGVGGGHQRGVPERGRRAAVGDPRAAAAAGGRLGRHVLANKLGAKIVYVISPNFPTRNPS